MSSPTPDGCRVSIPALELRDYFAGQALAGLMANPERYRYITDLVDAGLGQDEASMKNARKAYYLADAMLRVRSEGRS